jgi:predicted aspartyl protease
MEPIKWKYNKTKHLTIPLSINGNKLLFILDTRASNTIIDFSVAKKK